LLFLTPGKQRGTFVITTEWALNIQQQTEAHGAAFFFKQWGTWGSDGIKRNKHANGKVLDGKVVQQMPK
jgi:protein gp37